jgi:tetratricopeptide (TPR) repeat protein
MLSDLKLLGVTGYYRKYMPVALDFMKEDTSYFFRDLTKDGNLEQLITMLGELENMSNSVNPDDAELPLEVQKLARTLKADFPPLFEQFNKSLDDRNFEEFKAVFLKMFRLVSSMADAAIKYAEDDDDRNDARMMKDFFDGYAALMDAYFNHDRMKLLGAIDKLFKPLDRAIKNDGEESLDALVKTGSGESLSDIEDELADAGEDEFRSLVKLSSEQVIFRSVLMHFASGDKTAEGVLHRYGYLTAADIRSRADVIIAAVSSIRDKADEVEPGDNVPVPTVLPSDYSVLDNSIAVQSALMPEGRWLLSDDEIFLRQADEELSSLFSQSAVYEKKFRLKSGYLSIPILLRRAAVNYDRGNYSGALTDLKRALAVELERGDRQSVWQVYLLLALTEKRAGVPREAIAYLQSAVAESELARGMFRSETIRAAVVDSRMTAYEF